MHRAKTLTAMPQPAILTIGGRSFSADLGQAHDLAIVQDFDGTQPRWFGAPPSRSTPLVSGAFTGRVGTGGSCNCSTLSLTPHCDGTHTESAGHLTAERLDVRSVVPIGFLPALLLTVTPTPVSRDGERSVPAPTAGDLLITRAALLQSWPAALPYAPRALVVRTRPNSPDKRRRDYQVQPAPFLSLPAAALLVERGIEHLVLDVPSADRASDQGLLTAHREFFGLPAGETALVAVRRPQCTITELAYVDDAVPDGAYLLSLQIPSLGGDAVPSRPLLYAVRAQ